MKNASLGNPDVISFCYTIATIAMTGMKLVVSEEMNYRNTSVGGFSAALGIGIAESFAALATFPVRH